MDKEMSVEDLANMLCGSVDAEVVIKKHIGAQEVELEGGTGIVVIDMYLVVKALEQLSVKMLPLMRSAEALKQALHGMVDLFELEGE